MGSTQRSSALISLTEAAAQLGCSTKTIRRYISGGRLLGYRMGPRLIRVDAEAVAELLRPITAADRRLPSNLPSLRARGDAA